MMYIFISLGSPPITSRSRREGRGRGFRGRGRGFRGRGRGFRGRRGRRGHTGPGRGSRNGRGRGQVSIVHVTPTDTDDESVITWQKKEPSSMNFPYTGTPGPTASTSTLANESPVQLFHRYFTDDVWMLIVEETNRFASANVGHTPHARPWHDATVPELKAFLGMLILMGILELLRLEMYWQTKYRLIATSGISSI